MLICDLKVVMVRMRVSQTELAQRTGLSRETVNAVANGRVSPTLETALLIAQGLGVPVEHIWSLQR